MLVQMRFNDIVLDDRSYVGTCYCARCHKSIGDLTRDEVNYLVSYNGIEQCLCFECEDVKPRKSREYTATEMSNLLRMFRKTKVSHLPLSASSWWENPALPAILHNVPGYGWCYWIPRPGEATCSLLAVRLPHEIAAKLADGMSMEPRILAGASLVL